MWTVMQIAGTQYILVAQNLIRSKHRTKCLRPVATPILIENPVEKPTIASDSLNIRAQELFH